MQLRLNKCPKVTFKKSSFVQSKTSLVVKRRIFSSQITIKTINIIGINEENYINYTINKEDINKKTILKENCKDNSKA